MTKSKTASPKVPELEKEQEIETITASTEKGTLMAQQAAIWERFDALRIATLNNFSDKGMNPGLHMLANIAGCIHELEQADDQNPSSVAEAYTKFQNLSSTRVQAGLGGTDPSELFNMISDAYSVSFKNSIGAENGSR